jgi:hypothetical protein
MSAPNDEDEVCRALVEVVDRPAKPVEQPLLERTMRTVIGEKLPHSIRPAATHATASISAGDRRDR